MAIGTFYRRRVSNITLWGIAVALAIDLGWLVYKGVVPLTVKAASPVYTVLRTEKAFDKSGRTLYVNEYADAVRSDGAVMWRFASLVERQRRLGFPNGEGVVINELTGKKSTYPKSFSGIRVQRDPNTSCSSEADAKVGIAFEGSDYVGGYRALRFGQVTRDGSWKGWYLPDVGCALVQMRLEYATGVTVQQLASLNSR